MANPKDGVQLMNRKGEWSQNLPPKFSIDDPREGPQAGAAKPRRRNQKRAVPPGDEEKGEGGDDVVGLGVTNRHGDSQVKDKSEFFKPVAKRKKMEQREDLQPELEEMKSRASLKVPGHLEKILGVDLRSIGLVQVRNSDDMQPELTHVPPGIRNSNGEIDPTST